MEEVPGNMKCSGSDPLVVLLMPVEPLFRERKLSGSFTNSNQTTPRTSMEEQAGPAGSTCDHKSGGFKSYYLTSKKTFPAIFRGSFSRG